MCTALSLKTQAHYFGRNLDLDRSYGEEVCVMPRRFPFAFREMGEMSEHCALLGMATVVGGVPLFYDAVNEHGLSMAGLNFPGNAYYAPITQGKDNIAPFEFIPWILGQCKTVDEAARLLSRINLADIAFSEQLPPAPLHWMICDRERCVVAEFMRDGLHLHDNGVGVLTNNPPFEYQTENLKNFVDLRTDNSAVLREDSLPYSSYSQGLGAVGLPGDVSSMSRFVRMAFGRQNSVCDGDEESSVGQFFHLLSSVQMIKGLCKTDEGTWDTTVYSSCINTDRGLYYFTTYGNRRINCVDMRRTDLSGDTVSRFPLFTQQDIRYRN